MDMGINISSPNRIAKVPTILSTDLISKIKSPHRIHHYATLYNPRVAALQRA